MRRGARAPPPPLRQKKAGPHAKLQSTGPRLSRPPMFPHKGNPERYSQKRVSANLAFFAIYSFFGTGHSHRGTSTVYSTKYELLVLQPTSVTRTRAWLQHVRDVLARTPTRPGRPTLRKRGPRPRPGGPATAHSAQGAGAGRPHGAWAPPGRDRERGAAARGPRAPTPVRRTRAPAAARCAKAEAEGSSRQEEASAQRGPGLKKRREGVPYTIGAGP